MAQRRRVPLTSRLIEVTPRVAVRKSTRSTAQTAVSIDETPKGKGSPTSRPDTSESSSPSDHVRSGQKRRLVAHVLRDRSKDNGKGDGPALTKSSSETPIKVRRVSAKRISVRRDEQSKKDGTTEIGSPPKTSGDGIFLFGDDDFQTPEIDFQPRKVSTERRPSKNRQSRRLFPLKDRNNRRRSYTSSQANPWDIAISKNPDFEKWIEERKKLEQEIDESRLNVTI